MDSGSQSETYMFKCSGRSKTGAGARTFIGVQICGDEGVNTGACT